MHCMLHTMNLFCLFLSSLSHMHFFDEMLREIYRLLLLLYVIIRINYHKIPGYAILNTLACTNLPFRTKQCWTNFSSICLINKIFDTQKVFVR